MRKIIIGSMLVLSVFIGACSSSSSNDAKDTCTEDPNLPECLQGNEQENTNPEEAE
jgi:hypothetical protein